MRNHKAAKSMTMCLDLNSSKSKEIIKVVNLDGNIEDIGGNEEKIFEMRKSQEKI